MTSKRTTLCLMKKAARRFAHVVGARIPLAAYHRLVARDALGLLYHTVSAAPLAHIRHLYEYKDPCRFENDILFLKENYDLATGQELLGNQPQSCSRQTRPRAFVSFDDGLAECYSVVRPILLRNRAPCIFFVTTACIDNGYLMYRHKISLCMQTFFELNGTERENKLRQIALVIDAASVRDCVQAMKNLDIRREPQLDRVCQILEVDVARYLQVRKPYLTADDIRQLARDGFTIGAHSRRHPFLGDLDPGEIEGEIVGSCRTVSQITGERTVPFAFPFSGDKLDRSFLAALRQRHPVVGPMFDTRGLARDEPFIINRIAADSPAREKNKSNLARLLRREYCSYLLTTWR